MTTEIKIDSKGIGHVDKDPNATLDYVWRLTEWLDDDELDTVSFPSTIGVTVNSFSVETDTTVQPPKANAVVRAWISGGVVGQGAQAVLHFTTAGGRADDRTLIFKIRQR